MSKLDEDKIRARAYEIWDREGRPHGREADHWEQARRELMGETSLAGGKLTTEPGGRVPTQADDIPHGSVEDAKAGNATSGTSVPGDVNDAVPGGRRTRKRAAGAGGPEAATIPEPSRAAKPIRKSSAKKGDEAVTTPATEGRIKRAIRRPKGA